MDPFDQLERYTVDGMRYFLLSEGVPHSDGSKLYYDPERNLGGLKHHPPPRNMLVQSKYLT